MLGYKSTEKLEHFLYLYYEKGMLLYFPNENTKHKHFVCQILYIGLKLWLYIII